MKASLAGLKERIRVLDPALPRLLVRGRRGVFGLLVANGVGQAAGGIASGYAVAAAFTLLRAPGGLTNASSGRLVAVVAAIVVGAALAAWLRAREQVLAERLGQGYVHEVRVRLFDHLLASSLTASARRSTGASALRFTGDLTAVRQWVSRGLARMAVGVPFLLGVVGFLAVLAPVLALAVGGVLVAGLTTLASLGPELRVRARRARTLRARLAGDITERIGQLAVVVANGQSRRERDRVRRRSEDVRSAMLDRSRQVGRARGAAEGTVGASIAAVVLAGAFGGVAAPHVVAALTVVGFLATPIRDLGRVTEYREAARVSGERIAVALARPVRPVREGPGLHLPAGPGRLELQDVGVDGVIGPVTATIEPGRVIALAGPNGAGKSTLVRVIAGLATPDTGSVLLDDVDLARVRGRAARAAMGLVAPDLPLLRGSVARNVRYRRPDASPAELAAARRLVRLDDVIRALPDQEATKLSEGGGGLSAGQRVRIELARAVVGTPRLLLLDEPDGHLDAETSAILDRVLDEYPGTVLFVSHRPERLARADEVWWVANGRVTVQPRLSVTAAG